MIRTYGELVTMHDFLDRFNYLKLNGSVGKSTFGFDRYLNQAFYHSQSWQHIRDYVISRDQGCDLGVPGFELNKRILIHHMNPIGQDDILKRNKDIIDPEYLISVSFKTHNAIHFGDESQLPLLPVERSPDDMIPWKKMGG